MVSVPGLRAIVCRPVFLEEIHDLELAEHLAYLTSSLDLAEHGPA